MRDEAEHKGDSEAVELGARRCRDAAGVISVVELRRYTLKPGARETLIELFDREFVESQEALGMRILGTFRDLDDPDQFVWLRGFDDLAGRAPALEAFYTGPVWREHSAATNATMVDTDNVLLLRPADDGPSVDADPSRRPPVGAAERDEVLTAAICPAGDVAAVEAALAGNVLGCFVTEHALNDFPALPVRENVDVVVWLAAGELEVPVGVERLRLQPTPRSLLPLGPQSVPGKARHRRKKRPV
jgi:NIPSNAP